MKKGARLGNPQLLLLALASATLAGCMEMSYVVRLNENGSGRVTEVVKFSPKIVRLEKKLPKGEGKRLADLLTEERAKERAKLMGEGVAVASWKVEETTDGGVRLTAVYSFKDINDLKLCMFPMGKGWEKGHLRFRYTVDRQAKSPNFHLHCTHDHWRKSGGPPTTGESRGRPFFEISEVELQQVRRLLPVFKDMLRGFHLSVKLEIYEREKWATWKRGHGPSHWGYSSPAWDVNKSGGRATLVEVKESDLLTNDDGLMVLVPWRQIEHYADYRLQRMLGHTCAQGFYAAQIGFRWKAIQHARSREYH